MQGNTNGFGQRIMPDQTEGEAEAMEYRRESWGEHPSKSLRESPVNVATLNRDPQS